MRQVHIANDLAEAHLIKGLLEAQGITAMVVGHSEDISVWIVEDAPFQQAREVILALSGAGDQTGSEP